MNKYQHTQVGLAIIFPIAITIVVFLVLLAAGVVPVPVWGAALAVLIAPLMLALWATLTVSVDEKRLLARFGIGLIRKSIPLSRIASYQPVRMRWIHGFGIHYIPFRGWLYNVSGMQAVEIVTKSGKHTLIGTNEPETLCKALENALHNAPVGISR
jgi:hypothetical protein